MKSISTARSFMTTKKFNINVTLYYDTISNVGANITKTQGLIITLFTKLYSSNHEKVYLANFYYKIAYFRT